MIRLQFSSSNRGGRLCVTLRSKGSSARGEPRGLGCRSRGEEGGEARRRGAACFSRMAAAAHALIGLVRHRPISAWTWKLGIISFAVDSLAAFFVLCFEK